MNSELLKKFLYKHLYYSTKYGRICWRNGNKYDYRPISLDELLYLLTEEFKAEK